jgi:outer membrane protein
MAKLHAAAQDQASDATRADILLAVSHAYFAVLRAQAVLKVAEQTVAARQVVVDQIEALAQSKLKSDLDVSFAKVNLADAKLLEVQARNSLNAAQTDLATVIGTPSQTAFDVAEEAPPSPLPDRVDPLIAEAVQNRPELKNLRLEQDSRERFAKAEHRLFFPSVGLIATAGFVPAGAADVPGQYGAIGLNLTVPIFNGGLFRARQTEAELRAKAAAQNVTDLENRVIRDVRVAFLDAVTAYDRVGLTDQLLKQAHLAMELARSRYDLGLGTIVELSQAELNLTSAQIADANANYDYQAQRVVVDYQTGALR